MTLPERLNMGDTHHFAKIVKDHLGAVKPQLAEVGVFRGVNAALTLGMLPGSFLYMVDRWQAVEGDDDSQESWWNSGDGTARLSASEMLQVFYTADVLTKPFQDRRVMIKADSVVAASIFGTGALDAVFIDDDHSYAGVVRSINAWWPVLRNGGIMAGHDFGHPKNARGEFGVDKAVAEFVTVHNLDLKTVGSVWWVRKP